MTALVKTQSIRPLMHLSLLRNFDRRIGLFLLYALAFPARLVAMLLSAKREKRPRHVFLKLKGGGSLIIAMPALLGLRRQNPNAEFCLVCTHDARIYAELTGIFDTYIIIDDASFVSLIASGWNALTLCFRASRCVDLEPNSLLAAVFALLTCAAQRIGLVTPEQQIRAAAYTLAVAFNPAAPIPIYYDQIAAALGAEPASAQDSRSVMRSRLPKAALEKTEGKTIGIAPFTSDFAPERMMPPQTWIELFKREYGATPLRLVIFGSARNKAAAQNMAQLVGNALPAFTIINLCGDCSLAVSAATLTICDDVWAVDSGLLHLTRMLGVPNRSFWGPTRPDMRLRPIEDLVEHVQYRPFICSPCVQSSGQPPCGGQNICMISMAQTPSNLSPSWIKKT